MWNGLEMPFGNASDDDIQKLTDKSKNKNTTKDKNTTK